MRAYPDEDNIFSVFIFASSADVGNIVNENIRKASRRMCFFFVLMLVVVGVACGSSQLRENACQPRVGGHKLQAHATHYYGPSRLGRLSTESELKTEFRQTTSYITLLVRYDASYF